jgi:hypothetical protein
VGLYILSPSLEELSDGLLDSDIKKHPNLNYKSKLPSNILIVDVPWSWVNHSLGLLSQVLLKELADCAVV